MFSSFPSNTSKAEQTFLISLQMASHQSVSPFCSSIFFASSTDLGMRIPNLWVLSQYLDLTLASIWFLFLSTNGTHHANAGSIDIRVARANMATSTRQDSFISFKDTQFVLPSFHSINSSHPLVVSCLRLVPVLVVINVSCCFSSVPFVQ